MMRGRWAVAGAPLQVQAHWVIQEWTVISLLQAVDLGYVQGDGACPHAAMDSSSSSLSALFTLVAISASFEPSMS